MKKIIKSIIGIGILSSVAFVTYKIGTEHGKEKERAKHISCFEDDEDEDFDFYDDYHTYINNEQEKSKGQNK